VVSVTESTDLPDGPVDAPDAPAEVVERLAEVQANLTAQLSELDGTEIDLAVDENFADSGQVAAEEGENRALAAQLRDQLDDVERALAKLDDGTYGLCEVCSQPIGDARLEAMPAARFCIEHAG
jgi:RNA polymerase-binding transcription factor DksA